MKFVNLCNAITCVNVGAINDRPRRKYFVFIGDCGDFATFTWDDVGIVPYAQREIPYVGADAHIRPQEMLRFHWGYRRIRNLLRAINDRPYIHTGKCAANVEKQNPARLGRVNAYGWWPMRRIWDKNAWAHRPVNRPAIMPLRASTGKYTAMEGVPVMAMAAKICPIL